MRGFMKWGSGMRILELDLIAYGLFEKKTLDLSKGREGLHIIFGPNEAGKSTALRALKALLYGIPTRTPDNFKHRYNDLRVGATIRLADGSEIPFIRRKGHKNTLRDENDRKKLDDSFLTKLLSGVNADLFSNFFGINHISLREGGKDILSGEGDAGQALFSAGMGISGLRGVLSNLDEEAKQLFAERAQKPVINQALSELKDVKKMIRDASLSSVDWQHHHDTLKNSLVQKEKLDEEMTALRREDKRLDRIKKSLVPAAKRKEMIREREEMGEIPLLRENFTEERVGTVQTLMNARTVEKETEETLKTIEKEIENVIVPETILRWSDAIERLYKDRGGPDKAQKDLPYLIAQRDQAERDAETILHEVHPQFDSKEAEALQLTAQDKARISELSSQYQALINKNKDSKEKIDDLKRQIEEAKNTIQSMEEPKNTDFLESAIQTALEQGNVETVLKTAARECQQLEDECGINLEALPLWNGSLEGLEKLPAPPEETIDRFETEFSETKNELNKINGLILDEEKKKSDLDQKVDEIQSKGKVPLEEELTQAREKREEGWRLVKAAWLEKKENQEETKRFADTFGLGLPLSSAYEKSVVSADDVSDQLRNEADRAAAYAQLVIEREKCIQRIEDFSNQRDRQNQREKEIQNNWSNLWSFLETEPLPPKEMRSWMRKRDSLIHKSEEFRDKHRQINELKVCIEKCQSQLGRCLESLGEPKDVKDESLQQIIERARRVIKRIEQIAKNRENFETEVSGLEKELEKNIQIQKRAEFDLLQWGTKWADAVKPLGLNREASPGVANAVVGKIAESLEKRKDARGFQDRIDGINREMKQYSAEVKDLAEKAAPDLINQPALSVIDELYVRLNEARKKSDLKTRLIESLEKKTKVLEKARTEINQSNACLHELQREAHCNELDELPEAERKSKRAREIDQNIRNLEERLIELGDGMGVDELIQDAESSDADVLDSQIAGITEQIRELTDKQSKLSETIGAERRELESMRGDSKAAESAETAQEILARIRAGVERYTVVRLASAALRREIELYREKNQGPLLLRAGELFSELTLNSFEKLDTDFNEKDQLVLQGIRSGSGERIDVDGMSDGTRDQLYLSLRLASLERYLKNHEPMPFILDDVLVHFDDERSNAALRLFAEISNRAQVVYFTHHERLLELAQETVGEEILQINRL